MALRIDDAVIRGEIDNTVEGKTTGQLWLLGRSEPVILELEGDCWRDLAGVRLEFENPDPQEEADAPKLESRQMGVVGDITASRKARVATVGEEELRAIHAAGGEIPYEWKNLFYLEWFSETQGRVLIETADYVLKVSEHYWQMDPDAEHAQQLANLNAMRDFMATMIRRRPDSEEEGDPGETEMDEFEWEERLKESDRLSEAYQEVLEKYMEDEDAERKEAFVMGWDGLLDALAERDELDLMEPLEEEELEFSSTSSWQEKEGEEEADERQHPLQIQAYETALRSIDLVSREGEQDMAAHCLVSNLLQVSAKLAGALTGHGSGYEPETGFILAVLKRCLGWLNEAMAACRMLMDQEKDSDQLAALQALRLSIFEIRDGVVALRQKLRHE